jgi:8-oxo-dGTP pyrophosphatase MutT (NUDIX family)
MQPNSDNFISQLRQRFESPLPGKEAQYRMANFKRINQLHLQASPPADVRIACVLHLLHQQEDAWRTVLIRRSTNPNDKHSGQISFPGGRFEESDGALVNVAIREAQEEIGVESTDIEILGQLTELWIPVSNFLVYPFVGVLNGLPQFNPQPGEVESILTPSIDYLRNPAARKIGDVPIHSLGIVYKETPHFEVDGHIVWGATAMILNEFLEMLEPVNS